MKKRGLIVATIVMVLVLAVSLTTATYAWFTTSTSTSIDGFTLSVTAGNVMNIGLNKQGYTAYDPDATGDNFVSGACVYLPGDGAGTIDTGYWSGEVTGLSSTITHDILWGAQSKAVGFSSDANVDVAATNATYANTKFASQTGWTRIIKGNGSSTKLDSQEYAYANINKTGGENNYKSGDFVYLFLGAQPTKAIMAGTNKLYVVVQVQGQGNTIGMASAIHVAYKLNSASTWTDKDVWDGKHYSDSKAGNSIAIYGDYSGSQQILNGTYNAGTLKTTFPNAAVIEINLSEYTDATAAAPLDQIQLLIYIAGYDSDCIDMAKAGQIGIGIFFGAQEYVAPEPDPEG